MVLVIVALVSAVALPTIIPAIQHRQVSEAARILQGALAGARDKAIHDGQPSGIRLLPDPAFPVARLADGTIDPASVLAYNRIVPIGPAPEYGEGYCTVRRDYSGLNANTLRVVGDPTGVGKYRWPTLILEESPLDGHGVPNPPASWMWNVRVGDKIQLNNAGPWYTVVGPKWIGAAGNPELFVNHGPAGSASPLGHDYLLLANGRDDNRNGWVDEGWDGIDQDMNPQSPGFGIVDDVGEWEAESWHGAAAKGMTSVPYAIRRRPMPSPGAREVALPTHMVIDATTVFATRERSRLPVDRFTGFVDVMLNPDGTAAYNSPYGSPSSFGMADTFYHFFLMERQDVAAPTGTTVPLLPIAEPGGKSNRVFAGQVIKGEWALLTLFTRTGQVVSVESPPFDNPLAVTKNRPFNVNIPFIASQQGVR